MTRNVFELFMLFIASIVVFGCLGALVKRIIWGGERDEESLNER